MNTEHRGLPKPYDIAGEAPTSLLRWYRRLEGAAGGQPIHAQPVLQQAFYRDGNYYWREVETVLEPLHQVEGKP